MKPQEHHTELIEIKEETYKKVKEEKLTAPEEGGVPMFSLLTNLLVLIHLKLIHNFTFRTNSYVLGKANEGIEI